MSRLFAREQKAVAFANTSVSQDTTVDGDHGRIETRTVTVFHDIGWLQDNHQWPGLKSVVMVESQRETDGKVETETRFYITSLALLANALGPMIRSHWMVENGLHWVLDMIFRDDECRVRTDNAPFNLAIVKHIALNVLRTGKSKDSLRMRRKVAAWDENALAAYIAHETSSSPLALSSRLSWSQGTRTGRDTAEGTPTAADSFSVGRTVPHASSTRRLGKTKSLGPKQFAAVQQFC